MKLIPPRAGKRRILASSFKRCLYEQSFYYPDRKGGEREEVFSFWGYQGRTPVILFPVTNDGQVVSVRHFRHAWNDFQIETPGGIPHGSEPPEEVAKRELLEETGYQPAEVLVYREIRYDGSLAVQFTPCIGLGCVRVGEQELDSTEVMETLLVPLKEWYQKIWRGEILDAKFFALSLLALPILKERVGFSL